MPDFLAHMAELSRRRVADLHELGGHDRLSGLAAAARPPIPLRLSDWGFDLIAETKLASPSEGRLAAEEDDSATVVGLAQSLADAGPAALSILTEPSRFDGHLSHLEGVSRQVELPVMRKDFLVDPVQVVEARAAGASGVLLIARILSYEELTDMTDLALSLGMFALIEIFDEADIDRASAVFDREVLVGVNARDLATLAVDRDQHARLANLLPRDRPLVAESGVLTPEDAREVASLGYQLALVGTGLVKSTRPEELAAEMLAAGRQASRTGQPL